MAIKIFCQQCQNYIKDALPKELAKLTGEEICTTCRDRNRQTFDEVEAMQKDFISRMNRLYDEAKVQLDETLRKCLKGE